MKFKLVYTQEEVAELDRLFSELTGAVDVMHKEMMKSTDKLNAMHRRAQKAEGQYLRLEHIVDRYLADDEEKEPEEENTSDWDTGLIFAVFLGLFLLALAVTH